MKPVAVSQRVDVWPRRGEARDALDQRLSGFLLAAGYLPVAVPNALSVHTGEQGAGRLLEAWLAVVKPQAIVLSGGNDIGTCVERDATELGLLAYAEKGRLPVLGICRGMQMLAHWAGTGLCPVTGHAASRHRIDGTFQGEVNSYHRWALAGCPAGFEVLARSVDGCLEAIGHRQLPWEGWMWHPEREKLFRQLDIQRVKVLFE